MLLCFALFLKFIYMELVCCYSVLHFVLVIRVSGVSRGEEDELQRKNNEAIKKLSIINEGQREKLLILEKDLAHSIPTT